MPVATISPRGLVERHQAGPVELIDVRTPVEYQDFHVEFARNVPLDRLDPAAISQARAADSTEPIYVICRSGGRAQKACEKLLNAGLANVVNVEGGTAACVEAGLPIIRGKKAISLERQVRIVAGMLILLGVTLGYFVHPALYILPAFLGAGLVFSGITDFCGMALLLARMPWNQKADPKSTCSIR